MGGDREIEEERQKLKRDRQRDRQIDRGRGQKDCTVH